MNPTSFYTTVILLLFLACPCFAAPPTAADYKKLFAEKIEKEGEERIRLISFSATNLTEFESGGLRIRAADYQAELEFTQDTKWNVHPGIEFREFRTWKMVTPNGAKFDAATFNDDVNHPGMTFLTGNRVRVTGTFVSTLVVDKWTTPQAKGLIVPPTLEVPHLESTQEERAASSLKCLENLSYLGLAVMLWRTDNNDVMPTRVLDMTNEINSARLLVCPTDSSRTNMFGNGNAVSWAAIERQGSSYEFYKLGDTIASGEDDTVMAIRCPIHGHFARLDGKVVQKPIDGKYAPSQTDTGRKRR